MKTASVRERLTEIYEGLKKDSDLSWESLNVVGRGLLSVSIRSVKEPLKVGSLTIIPKFNSESENVVYLEFEDPKMANEAQAILKVSLYGSRLDSYIDSRNGSSYLMIDMDIASLTILDQLISTSLTIPEDSGNLDKKWEHNLRVLSHVMDIEDALKFSKRSTPAWVTRITVEYSKLVDGNGHQDAIEGLALAPLAGSGDQDIMMPDPEIYIQQRIFGKGGILRSVVGDFSKPVEDIGVLVKGIKKGDKTISESLQEVASNDYLDFPEKVITKVLTKMGLVAVKAMEFLAKRAKIRDENKVISRQESKESQPYIHPDINVVDLERVRDDLYQYKLGCLLKCDLVQARLSEMEAYHDNNSPEREVFKYRKIDSKQRNGYNEARVRLREIIKESHHQKHKAAAKLLDMLEAHLAERVFDKRTDKGLSHAARFTTTDGHEFATRISERIKAEEGYPSMFNRR